MKTSLFISLLILTLTSCQNKPKAESFSDHHNLECITEKINIDDYKKQLQKDSINLKADDDEGNPEVIIHKVQTESGQDIEWKEYSYRSDDVDQSVGKLSSINLGSVHFIIYNDQLIGAIGSIRSAGNDDDIQSTINYLTKKYGLPVDLAINEGRKSIVGQEVKLYWQNEDKIIGIALAHGGANPGDVGVIPITTYQVYVINQQMEKKLEKEKIALTDFFSDTKTENDFYAKNILSDIILEDIKSRNK